MLALLLLTLAVLSNSCTLEERSECSSPVQTDAPLQSVTPRIFATHRRLQRARLHEIVPRSFSATDLSTGSVRSSASQWSRRRGAESADEALQRVLGSVQAAYSAQPVPPHELPTTATDVALASGASNMMSSSSSWQHAEQGASRARPHHGALHADAAAGVPGQGAVRSTPGRRSSVTDSAVQSTHLQTSFAVSGLDVMTSAAALTGAYTSAAASEQGPTDAEGAAVLQATASQQFALSHSDVERWIASTALHSSVAARFAAPAPASEAGAARPPMQSAGAPLEDPLSRRASSALPSAAGTADVATAAAPVGGHPSDSGTYVAPGPSAQPPLSAAALFPASGRLLAAQSPRGAGPAAHASSISMDSTRSASARQAARPHHASDTMNMLPIRHSVGGDLAPRLRTPSSGQLRSHTPPASGSLRRLSAKVQAATSSERAAADAAESHSSQTDSVSVIQVQELAPDAGTAEEVSAARLLQQARAALTRLRSAAHNAEYVVLVLLAGTAGACKLLLRCLRHLREVEPPGEVAVLVAALPSAGMSPQALRHSGFGTLPALLDSTGASVWAPLFTSARVPKAHVIRCRDGSVVCPDAIGMLQARSSMHRFPWVAQTWADKFEECAARAVARCSQPPAGAAPLLDHAALRAACDGVALVGVLLLLVSSMCCMTRCSFALKCRRLDQMTVCAMRLLLHMSVWCKALNAWSMLAGWTSEQRKAEPVLLLHLQGSSLSPAFLSSLQLWLAMYRQPYVLVCYAALSSLVRCPHAANLVLPEQARFEQLRCWTWDGLHWRPLSRQAPQLVGHCSKRRHTHPSPRPPRVQPALPRDALHLPRDAFPFMSSEFENAALLLSPHARHALLVADLGGLEFSARAWAMPDAAFSSLAQPLGQAQYDRLHVSPCLLAICSSAAQVCSAAVPQCTCTLAHVLLPPLLTMHVQAAASAPSLTAAQAGSYPWCGAAH